MKPVCSVQQPGAKTTEVEAHMWQLDSGLCFYQQWQAATGNTKLILTAVDWITSGRAIHKWYHLINARNLAHEFSVSLVHASVVMLAALTGEMAGICDYVCIIKLA